MASHISWLTAFRFSGWLKMIQPIGPSFSTSSFGVSVIAFSLSRPRASDYCQPFRQ